MIGKRALTEDERMNYWWKRAKAAEATVARVEALLPPDGVFNGFIIDESGLRAALDGTP